MGHRAAGPRSPFELGNPTLGGLRGIRDTGHSTVSGRVYRGMTHLAVLPFSCELQLDSIEVALERLKLGRRLRAHRFRPLRAGRAHHLVNLAVPIKAGVGHRSGLRPGLGLGACSRFPRSGRGCLGCTVHEFDGGRAASIIGPLASGGGLGLRLFALVSFDGPPSPFSQVISLK